MELDDKTRLLYGDLVLTEVLTNNLPSPNKEILRLYAWVPRSEVNYIQASLDGYDGLARLRTERHQNDRSLLLFMVPPSRKIEFDDFLRQMTKDLSGPILSV